LGKNVNEDGGFFDSNFGTTSWPACGELDIMEHGIFSNQPINYVGAAIHTPSSFGNTQNKGGIQLGDISQNYYVYSMNWSPNQISFLIDGVVFYTYNPAVKNASTWPFDAEQYFILNFAIQPSIAANFTQGALEIDYIRVYQENNSTNLKVELKNQPLFYPNPVNNELNIVLNYNYEKSIPVCVHSIDGKLLINENYLIKNGAITLNNLDKLTKGVYLVSFEMNQQLQRFKIIKN
jgi:beta-glucanase (GH16 family)